MTKIRIAEFSAPGAVVMAAFALFAALCPKAMSAASPEALDGADLNDLRAVIARARERVSPAVAFLMPIAERFDAGRREKAQLAGSGVVVSEDGEIVTNWHVVNRAVEIRCLLSDGVARRAEIVGIDKDTDLALLRIDRKPEETFAFAELGDGALLEEGQFVIAMGAPWGLSRSVSLGILSCVDRFLPDQGGGYNLWLQTDASINPGNSGGPLVNTEGKVVGINSLGSLLGGNLAFAIPADTVKRVTDALRRDGRVVRAWTGLHLQPLRDFQKNIFYDWREGVLIGGVQPDSPAERAGVAVGDLLLSVNGKPVAGVNHEDIPPLNLLLAELPVGEAAELILQGPGGASRRTVSVTPMEKGRVEGVDFDCRRWNMAVKTINEFSTPMLHFFQNGGVYVQAVKFPGNAQAAGLENGDIILEIDGVRVRGLDDCREMYETIIRDEAREKKVVFTVLRAGLSHYFVLDYAPRYGLD
ncbi:MAG: trypsin-like peptidase domain-containing protein [Planctomycetota bacterium]|jgi:serine protease Do|nr:trypsin-like peptidase domain-containing protein [Planctomycetota bacterium]